MGFLRTAETRWGSSLARSCRLHTGLTASELAHQACLPVALWATHHETDADLYAAAASPTRVNVSVRAVAHVNWGRWLAHCPFCGAAHEISPVDHRFYCPLCLNVGADGEFIPVVWPNEVTVAAVEDILGRRPDRRNRNWVPSETVVQLQAENAIYRDELLPHPMLV